MDIQTFSKDATGVNEDDFFVGEQFGFVLDGATGLLKENITPNPSDAQWFVKQIKKQLIATLPNTHLSLAQILSNAIEEVSTQYLAFEGAAQIKSKPSAGIAMWRILNNELEYLLLGDVSLLIQHKNNTTTALQVQDLPKLDGQNIAKMVAVAKEKNIAILEARKLINDDLLRVRLSQNTPQGYYIVADNPSAPFHALCGSMPLEDVAVVAALSDGYSQTYDTFEIFKSPAELMEQTNKNSLEEIYQTLFEEQENDKDCSAHPRFKLRDDATMVMVRF